MSRKNNAYSKEFKLRAIDMHLNQHIGANTIAKELGLRGKSRVYQWVKLYQEKGETAFDEETRGKSNMNAVKDLYNDEIVAYEISLRNDTRLVHNTLNKLFDMGIPKGCILHTDQGFQYTREDYCKQLKNADIIQSMSRRGNCWDNAPIEIFFGHLKSELIYLVKTTDVTELTNLIHQYIDFYNNERIHLKSGMSPVEYRTHAA